MSELPFSLEWERLGNAGADAGLVTERARVFGGWLVPVLILGFVFRRLARSRR